MTARDSPEYQPYHGIVEPYLPVGDPHYVLRKRWPQAVGCLLLIIIGCWFFGWLGVVIGSSIGISAPVVIVGTILISFGLLVSLVADWMNSGLRSGVEFAIDERGIYFGARPQELVPWGHVREIQLHRIQEKRLEGEVVNTRYVLIEIAAPQDAGPVHAAAGRQRHVNSFLNRVDWDAIEHAAARHAPPHVRVVAFPVRTGNRGTG